MNNKIDADVIINEENDDSIKEIIEAAGELSEIEIPDGFHDEIMRAIRIEASGNAEKSFKKTRFSSIAKIFKSKYIFALASAACLILVVMAVLPLVRPKYSYAPQYAGGSAAPAAEAPMAAPAPMAAAMPEEAYDIGGAIYERYDEKALLEAQMAAGETIEMEWASDMAETGIAMDTDGLANSYARRESEELSDNQSSAINISALKIIKTSNYSLEVTDFDKTISEIQRIAESAGGYVESFSSSIYNTFYMQPSGSRRDLKSGYICVRVPQIEYSHSKIQLEGLGKVTSTSEAIDNITSQYVDMAARLDVKKTEEQRLLELYGKAEKIEDLISLETRLAYVRADIESMMAQLQNWDRSVSFSTINISINEVADYTQLQTIDPTLGEKIIEGFYRSVAAFTYGVERLIVRTAENSIAILVVILIAIVFVAVLRIVLKKIKSKEAGTEKNII